MPCTSCNKSFNRSQPARRLGRFTRAAALSLLGLLAVQPAFAVDFTTLPATLTQHYVSQTPMPGPAPVMSLNEAMVVQGMVVNTLSRALGAPIGYKAGLTSTAAQARFGVSEPLRGVLLKRMILPDGATLAPTFGARPFAEADLLVEVGSRSINGAKTPEQALEALAAVIPFIELPDLLFARGVALDGPAIAAINVGARYGIAGKRIPITPGGDWLRRLENMDVTLSDDSGQISTQGSGDSLMGHPLNVVLWLVDSLNKDGINLGPGDLLSLGSFTAMVPVSGEGTLTARYDKLDPTAGPVTVQVHFKRDQSTD